MASAMAIPATSSIPATTIVFVLQNTPRAFSEAETTLAYEKGLTLVLSPENYSGVVAYFRDLKKRTCPSTLTQKGISHTKEQSCLSSVFHHIKFSVLGSRIIKRESLDLLIFRLLHFAKKHPEVNLPHHIKIIPDNIFFGLISTLAAIGEGRHVRISDAKLNATLEIDSAIDGPEETLEAVKKVSTLTHVERAELLKNPAQNIPLCGNPLCQQKWRYSFENFLTQFPKDGWKLGKVVQGRHTPLSAETITNISASKSGSLCKEFTKMCRKCTYCETYNSYSFYQTLWVQAQGSIPDLQKIANGLIVSCLNETNRKVVFCPHSACSFSQSGILVKVGADKISCPTCTVAICIRCGGKEDASHLCPSDMERLVAEGRLQQCSKCHHHYERAVGCAHMTCPAPCSHEYCYHCGKDYRPADGRGHSVFECEDSRLRYDARFPLMDPLERYRAWLLTRSDEAIQAERERLRRLELEEQQERRERQELEQQAERERRARRANCTCPECQARRQREAIQLAAETAEAERRLRQDERNAEIQRALQGRPLAADGFPEYNPEDFA
jgi:hypothetical protein